MREGMTCRARNCFSLARARTSYSSGGLDMVWHFFLARRPGNWRAAVKNAAWIFTKATMLQHEITAQDTQCGISTLTQALERLVTGLWLDQMLSYSALMS